MKLYYVQEGLKMLFYLVLQVPFSLCETHISVQGHYKVQCHCYETSRIKQIICEVICNHEYIWMIMDNILQ